MLHLSQSLPALNQLSPCEKKPFRRAASAAATITGIHLKPLGDGMARKLLLTLGPAQVTGQTRTPMTWTFNLEDVQNISGTSVV